MAPSTPPPPSRLVLAAFTIASTSWSTMSPEMMTSLEFSAFDVMVLSGK